MRRVALPLLLSFVVLTAGFAPAPLPRPERRPRPPGIEGLWSGGVNPDGVLRREYQTVRITNDRMIYRPDGPSPFVYAMELDRAAQPPRYHINGVSSQGATGRGIWRVEGDVLMLSYNSVNGPWPTAFVGPGKGNTTEVYRRVGR